VLQGLLSTDAQNNQAVLAEVARVMQLPDGYLWHEYLEAINHPVYLHQFLAHAAAHGLQFIGDGAVGVNWFDDLGPQVEPAVTASVSDAMEREHFRDVFRNRSFRQTLLCRQELEVSRNVTLAAMKGLVLEGAFTPENPLFDLCGTTHENFVHRAGGRVTTADRLLKAALAEVGGAWPGFVAFDELIAAATRRLTEAGCPPDTNEVQQLQATVVDCCARMVFQVHSHDALFATRPSDTPQGSPLARAQARVSNRVANRRHEPVTLNGLDRWLFAQFDGKTTNSQVVERAVLACNEGKLLVRTQTGQPYAGAGAQQLFESEVPASIQRLTDAALFVR
jgi:methyltransferase-like protein